VIISSGAMITDAPSVIISSGAISDHQPWRHQ